MQLFAKHSFVGLNLFTQISNYCIMKVSFARHEQHLKEEPYLTATFLDSPALRKLLIQC